MNQRKDSFTRIFPLYYVLFVFVFVFLYLAVSGSNVASIARSADQTYASENGSGGYSRACLPPPCGKSWWCRFWQLRRGNSCLYPTPVPVPSDSPIVTPSDSPVPTSQVCIPRPSCLDAIPSCKIAEPADGWCPTASKEPIVCPMYMLLCPDGSYGAPDPANNCKARCAKTSPSINEGTLPPAQSFKPRASCFKDLPCISIE